MAVIAFLVFFIARLCSVWTASGDDRKQPLEHRVALANTADLLHDVSVWAFWICAVVFFVAVTGGVVEIGFSQP